MKIKDKTFKILIKEEDLQDKIATMAKAINQDYKGKSPIFVGILNGSFMFVGDIMKHISLSSKVSFIKLASYNEMTSSGIIKELIGLNEDIFEQDVIILEDIIDSGLTITSVIEEFKNKVKEALDLIKKADYYSFLISYIKKIVDVNGFSQLREAEVAIWVNKYAVADPVDAASFFIQKAYQMKEYIETPTQ